MTDSKTPVLVTSNKLYDYGKYVTQILLPAVGTLYVAIAALWGLPAPEAVGGTILAVDTFLGVVLHVSKAQYDGSDVSTDGSIDVTQTEDGKKTFALGLNGDPENLDQQDKVVFKVNKK